jgi:hypothetical protein
MSSNRSGAPAALITIKHSSPLSRDELLTAAGYSPDSAAIDGVIDQQVDFANAKYAYKFRVREDVLTMRDIRELSESMRTYKFKRSGEDEERYRVIVETDQQIGKCDENGGTPELLERWANIRAQICEDLERDNPYGVLHAELGDPVENFLNHAGQGFTNDLDISGQQRVYAQQSLLSASEYSRRVKVYEHSIVASNHGQASRSVGASTPNNDHGITNSYILEQTMKFAGVDATFHRPTEWSDSVAVNLFGFRIAMAHGHQRKDSKQYWRGQELGNTALAGANVFVRGHMHHVDIEEVVAGRWGIGAPSLDGGSAWLKNITGESATAGMLTFDMVKGRGFDPHSIRIYTEQ